MPRRKSTIKIDADKLTRISEPSLLLIRMYAGELQRADGKNRTDDRAILELFKQCRPDLVADFLTKYPQYAFINAPEEE